MKNFVPGEHNENPMRPRVLNLLENEFGIDTNGTNSFLSERRDKLVP